MRPLLLIPILFGIVLAIAAGYYAYSQGRGQNTRSRSAAPGSETQQAQPGHRDPQT